jgi:hypothetical protein
MHEWLEALQKSAKTTSQGVAAEELRRAETEAGVPLPGELGDLYSAFNGGGFEGEVVLYPLHGEGEQASVLEKTRKMLVGLPAAGVWRFGLKGAHRHLYTARKSAMVEQGDGGGPLPEWVQALGDEDWIYGTWDEDQKEMRFYRSLSNMLNVLVPPVEREEFGDRTFARAIAAVEGALTELAEDEEQEAVSEPEGAAALEPGLENPAVIAAERRMKKLQKPAAKKEAGLETATVIAAERRIEGLKSQPSTQSAPAPRKKAAARTAAKKAPAKKAPAKKAAVKKAPAKKAAAKKALAKKVPAKKTSMKKAAAKKPSVKKVMAKKTPVKKGAARRKR